MAEVEIIDVDPDGEVILICGCDETDHSSDPSSDTRSKKTIKICVRAIVLTLNSPVFKALLSPRFKEGSELAANFTAEIPLPDDEGYAMHALCQVLHLRNKSFSDSMPYDELLKIANLADKYDCTEAVMHAAELWMYGL